MEDLSFLDKKYFCTNDTYNCPFCNRNHVSFRVNSVKEFNWDNETNCLVYFVQCLSCKKVSMHLSFDDLTEDNFSNSIRENLNIDEHIFYSQPTSFFSLDLRIPKIIRELIVEGESCIKMNLLTGASACIRKAIYELLVKEEAEGSTYEEKIKSLKDKFIDIDKESIDVLNHIKDMTSEKIHEQSWEKWDSESIKLIVESLRSVLIEIYVIPAQRKSTSKRILELKQSIDLDKRISKINK